MREKREKHSSREKIEKNQAVETKMETREGECKLNRGKDNQRQRERGGERRETTVRLRD